MIGMSRSSSFKVIGHNDLDPLTLFRYPVASRREGVMLRGDAF